MEADDLKTAVKEKYSKIVNQTKQQNVSSCCGATGCCTTVEYVNFSENYELLEGYNSEADLGLGCGIPTEFAGIKLGDHVLDLGSGAGNDCFVARAIVGDTGHVIGIDFTDAMIERARENVKKRGYANVDFIKGDIEKMPFEDNQFDVIVSNCVLNLVPDKNLAFAEIKRVLKHGGHFCVSDVVIKGVLPEKLRKDVEMYAGCVSGAIELEEYMEKIKNNGFTLLTIHKQKEISIPDETMLNYLSKEEVLVFKNSGTGIFSITISGYKE